VGWIVVGRAGAVDVAMCLASHGEVHERERR